MHPERLAIHRASIERDPAFEVHGTDIVTIYGDGPWRSLPPIPDPLPSGRDITDELGSRNPITHSSICYRRAAIERIGGYDESFDLMNDYWTWVRMANAGSRFVLVPVIANAVRVHSRQNYLNTPTARYAQATRRVQRAYLTGSRKWPASVAWAVTLPRIAYGFLPVPLRRRLREHLTEADARTALPAVLMVLLWAWVFFLPLQFEPHVGIRTGVSDAFGFAAILLALAIGRFPRMRDRRLLPWIMVPLGIMTAAATALVLNGSLSRYALVNKIIGIWYLFAMALLLAHNIRKRSLWIVNARLLLGSLLALNLFALVEHLFDFSLGWGIPGINYGDNRLSGFLIDPNAYAGLLALGILLCISTFGAEVFGKQRGLRWVSAFVLAASLLLTFSRSGWIGFAFGTLTLLVLDRPARKALVGAGAVGVAGVTAVWFSPAGAGFRAVAWRPTQVNQRIDQFSDAYALFRAHPVFGAGLGHYTEEHGFIIHNTTAWLAAEGGLVSVSLTLGGLLWIAARALRVGRHSGWRDFAVMALACHVAMLGVSVGIEALYQRHWWLMMAAVLAGRLAIEGTFLGPRPS
jgi:hypothetical protein